MLPHIQSLSFILIESIHIKEIRSFKENIQNVVICILLHKKRTVFEILFKKRITYR